MHKLKSVQFLRALAALLVTIAHASEEAKHFFNFKPLIETIPFGKGVDIFFVISGFIIYYSSQKLFATPGGVGRFAYNRFSRVVPLYYIFTTLMVLVVVFLPSGVKEARLDIAQIISSYTFFPYARYDGRIAPILSLGWTLNYEIFFYALFSMVVWLPGRKAAAVMLGVLMLLVGIGLFLPASAPAALRAWTDDIILEFGLGVLIAVLYEAYGKRFARSNVLAIAVLVIGLALIYVLNLPELLPKWPRILLAGLPAGLVVGAAVLLLPEKSEEALPGWGTALGDSSYSLYLSHRFVQRPIQIFIHKLNLPGLVDGAIYLVLAVIGAVVAGHIVFKVVEQPLLRALRSKKSAPANVR